MSYGAYEFLSKIVILFSTNNSQNNMFYQVTDRRFFSRFFLVVNGEYLIGSSFWKAEIFFNRNICSRQLFLF